MTSASSPVARSIRCPQCALTLDSATSPLAPGWNAQSVGVNSPAPFPAFDNPPAESPPSMESGLEGEAACFFTGKARGRGCEVAEGFCPLCDLPFGARHLCPACLAARKPAESSLSDVSVDGGAARGILPLFLALVIWPFLIFTVYRDFSRAWGWRKRAVWSKVRALGRHCRPGGRGRAGCRSRRVLHFLWSLIRNG